MRAIRVGFHGRFDGEDGKIGRRMEIERRRRGVEETAKRCLDGVRKLCVVCLLIGW